MGPAPDGTSQDRIPVILTHEGVSSVWKQRAARGPATRDVEHRNRIAEHVERTLGTKIELFISERQPCHGLTVDVLVVPPTDERPFYVLVTRGLSEMYMNVHPLAKHSPSRIELVICLPKTWEVSLEAFRKSEQYFWPVRQLKRHALFPAIHNTFISLGHTVANELVNDDIPPSPDNPSRPFCSNTTMNSMLMMVPALLPEEFHIMVVKKPNKKKKKRARKRDNKTTATASTSVVEANGQREGATNANANGNGNGNENVNGEKETNGERGVDGLPNQQPKGKDESSNGSGSGNGNGNGSNETEGKAKENEKEGEGANPEDEEVKGQQQQQQQEGEKKKGRRRRGGKKKNKKSGENNTSNGIHNETGTTTKKEGEAEVRQNGAPTGGAGGADSERTEERAKGREKERQQQQRQHHNRNEEPFLYGENKEDVYFYQLLPLYQEEVDFKLKHGLDALLERLEQLPPLDVMTITPGRKNVCQMPVKRKILRAKRRASPKSPGGGSQHGSANTNGPTPSGGYETVNGTTNGGSPSQSQQEQEPELEDDDDDDDDEGQDQQRHSHHCSHHHHHHPHHHHHHHPQQQEQEQEQRKPGEQDLREKESAGDTPQAESAAKAREDVGKVETNGKGNEHK